MGKNNLLLATLFASAALLTPQIVHADAVDTATQADSSVQSTQVEQQTTPDQQASTVQTQAESADTTAQTNQDTQVTQDSQTAQPQDTARTKVGYTDQAVDGVFTVNGNIAHIYDPNGQLVTNRALMANTDWYTNARRSVQNGKVYYHVATSEYVDSESGAFTNNVESYTGTADVVYKSNSSIHSFSGYGSKATYLGNDLATGSSWQVNKRAKVGNKYWYQIAANTWIPQDNVVLNNTSYASADWVTGVPLISQRPELPNGCEITAVTMMLQYAGANVNKMQLAQEIPRSSNPNYGYMGQPWDNTGITIFPPALMNLVEKYAGTAKNMTGETFDAIKYQINIGHPVVTWNTLHGFPYHALVVTGYDANNVYYNDCWTNQSTQMNINSFIANWDTQNRRAISY